MVKLIYCINRLPHLSVREFQDYWFTTHGPIAGKIKGVKRYVQCHTLPETYADGREPAYDGAAELWWDNLEAMQADTNSPEVEAALTDERNFIDHSRVTMFVTDEKVVLDELAGAEAVKLIVCLKRKADSSREDFEKYWGSTHQDLGRKIPGLLKYTRSLTVAGVAPDQEPEYDGAAELSFRDFDALRESLTSPEAASSGDDIANFADSDSQVRFITRERVVVGQR